MHLVSFVLACQCEAVLHLGGRRRRPARWRPILAEYVGSMSVVAVLSLHEWIALSIQVLLRLRTLFKLASFVVA